jgi:hypothetical protein
MFFTYYQNNSGGSFVGPHFVIIEADSNSEADYIAENHPDSPIYFDGCENERDCECCGDRWYRTYDDGTEKPEIYGNTDLESEASERMRCSREEPSFLVIRKQVKTSEDLRAKIELILAYSDIVWTKYGTETIADLTEKILKAVRNE